MKSQQEQINHYQLISRWTLRDEGVLLCQIVTTHVVSAGSLFGAPPLLFDKIYKS